MTKMAFCYEKGFGVSQDHELAYKWYKKAASFEDPIAITRIGDYHFIGKFVKQDKEEAFRHYVMASKLNPNSSLAHYKVGLCLAKGEGVARDNSNAFINISKAANMPDQNGAAHQAMYLLGNFYKNGLAYDKDGSQIAESPEKAFKWYKNAVKAGNPMACASLGYCYYYGFGTEKNLKLAKEALETGVKRNNPQSARALKALFK